MRVSKTNIHLIISVSVVIPAALMYGFFPNQILDIQPNTIDEHIAYKAICMLYLGFSMLWVLAILKPLYLKYALLSNSIFMLGLAGGRLLSLVLDGTPSLVYIFGTIGELVLGIYGMWILKTNQFVK